MTKERSSQIATEAIKQEDTYKMEGFIKGATWADSTNPSIHAAQAWVIEKQEARITKLSDALLFYANPKNHEIRHASEGVGPDPNVYRDNGRVARRALELDTE